MRTRKLWVPHISRSEMWEGCRTAFGSPEETAGVLNTFQPTGMAAQVHRSHISLREIWGTHSFLGAAGRMFST